METDRMYPAEEKHAICLQELQNSLILTEGIPVIKIIDIAIRHGFNVKVDTT